MSERCELPDAHGRFGPFGGRYVPETLTRALEQLTAEYERAAADAAFAQQLAGLYRHYVGRPSPLYFAERLSRQCGGAQIYLKREDLNHTGSHKINNTLGQALLALRMGKRRVIAETGAGQHGVATATACAHFGLDCVVYMGTEDIRRQRPNVFSMKLLGAEVRPVSSGSRTLRDAVNEAFRDWMNSVEGTHYCLGSVVGPHPFPRMVRDFQSVIGRETRAQCLEQLGRLPEVVVACVGGGSNAAGMFSPLVADAGIELVGVEAGGRSDRSGDHAATLCRGRPGVLHGSFSYVLQDDDGQTADVHSVSAGLDYPGTGPEHSYWKESGRVRYTSARDEEALAAFDALARSEGILPALESSHAVAEAMKLAAARPPHEAIVVCLSGRGDKDAAEIARLRARSIDAMSQIDAVFSELRRQGRKALMPFVTAGDPDLDFTAALLGRLVARGAALCELGIPYSDPVADGPVIQASYSRALAGKIKLDAIFAMLGGLTSSLAAPVVTMVSYAIVYRRGLEEYVAAAQAAGVAGLIVPDLPVEEAGPLAAVCRRADLSLIQLVTPTTPRERALRIAECSSGFIYYVSVAGITGERSELPPQLVDEVAWLRWQTPCRSASASASAGRSTCGPSRRWPTA